MTGRRQPPALYISRTLRPSGPPLLAIFLVWAIMFASVATRAADNRDENRTLPVNEAQERELLALVGDDFVLHRTAHFVIVHNAAEESVADFARRAEHTYGEVTRFCDVADIPSHALTDRMAVLFFDTPADYASYGASTGFDTTGSSGFYSVPLNRSAFFNTLNTSEVQPINAAIEDLQSGLDRRGPDRLTREQRKAAADRLHYLRNRRERLVNRVNRLVIQHEVAHQIFYNIGVHTPGAKNPEWLVEGLACLFETPPGPSGSGLGTVNQMRLRDFRNCISLGAGDRTPRADNFRHAVNGGCFVTLDRLVSDPRVLRDGSLAEITVRYAQAWALVQYLQRHRHDEFAEYVKIVSARMPCESFTPEQERQLFESVFGPINQRFVERWVDATLRLPYRPAEID